MKLSCFFRFRCKCGSARLRRSCRRSQLENVMRKVICPWRCETCDTGSFKFSWVKAPAFRMRPLDRLAAAYDRAVVPSDYD